MWKLKFQFFLNFLSICSILFWAAVVVADDPADPNEFPWLVRIIIEKRSAWDPWNADKHVRCTGAMVDPSLVLTTAHCLIDGDTGTTFEPFRIKMHIPGESLIGISASSLHLHPSFLPETKDYNLGLIRLAQPLSEPLAEPRINLLTSQQCSTNNEMQFFEESALRTADCWSVGFGLEPPRQANQTGASLLRKQFLVIDEYATCLLRDRMVAFNAPSKLCARTTASMGLDSPQLCQWIQDRGGGRPLVCFDPFSQTYQLIGVSGSEAFEDCSLSMVFARICSGLPWIRGHINQQFRPRPEMALPPPIARTNGTMMVCGPAPLVPNGQVTHSDTFLPIDIFSQQVGLIGTVRCNDGYQLRGANIVVCLGNGFWSQPGSCQPIAATLPITTTTRPISTSNVMTRSPNQFLVNGLVSAVDQNLTDVVRNRLTDLSPAEVNAAREDGELALVKASCSGNVAIVQLLLDAGANVELASRTIYGEGFFPLACAAWNQHRDVVRLLLDRAANVNRRLAADFYPGALANYSPLMLAARQGDHTIVMMLLERGADRTGCDMNALCDSS